MKMKAIVYEKYGPPEVLQLKEVEKPIPKDNEVLIKIHATTVAFGDIRMRKPDPQMARLFNGLFKPKRRKILGMELSGIIENVGTNVKNFKKNDEVFASSDLKMGSYAEYICLPEDGAIASKPTNTSFEEAAAVCFGGLGAYHFFRLHNIHEGQKVLINGASGSTGSAAVQIGKFMGAEVTGVCSTKNLEIVKSIGADHVIDYTEEDFTASQEQYDFIFDAVGKTSKSACKEILASNGIFASIMKGGGSGKQRAQDILVLQKMVEEGKMKPLIDRTYPMEEISKAHEYVEKGRKVGNVIIKIVNEGGNHENISNN